MSVRVIAVSLLALVSSIVAQAEPTPEARDMSRRVRGGAVDEQGKPIEGVSVAMLVERESGLMPEQYSSAAVTAADGAFELTGVLGSGAALVVTADGHHRSALSFVAPGTDVIVDLTPGGSVAGTVRDADGRPCPGASIWTYFEAGDHWEPHVADEVGRFAFSLAFPHGYRIQATVGPTRPFVDESRGVVLEGPAAGVDLMVGPRIDPDHAVVLRTVDANTGKAIEEIRFARRLSGSTQTPSPAVS